MLLLMLMLSALAIGVDFLFDAVAEFCLILLIEELDKASRRDEDTDDIEADDVEESNDELLLLLLTCFLAFSHTVLLLLDFATLEVWLRTRTEFVANFLSSCFLSLVQLKYMSFEKQLL